MIGTVLVLIHVLGAISTAAQSFVPNPAWRNPNITTSPEERIAIAKGAIDTTLSMTVDEKGQLKLEDTNYAAAARFFAQMAEFDGFTNQSIYKSQLLNLFSQAESFRPEFAHVNINWRLEYSIAAMHAYATYSDSKFLDWAKTAWSSGRSYTLSEVELGNGKVFGKNATMKSSCENLTMAGGTFWNNKTDNPYLNALSTGTYLVATSMLAEITKEDLYLTSGFETEAFYFNHLRNPQGDMLDGIPGDSCAPNEQIYPINAGLMTEGLAVLASVTKIANLTDHLLEVVNKIVSNTVWHSEAGIVAGDSVTSSTEHVGQFMVRGLAAIYQRDETYHDSSLRDYIRQYLGVQYNAVLKNARSVGNNRNIYSAAWTGSPSMVSNFDFDSQTNAMSILVAAIPVRDSDSNTPHVTGVGPPVTTAGPTASPAPDPRSLDIGAIAGGVIGGLALVSLILTTALYLIRRHRSLSSVTVSMPASERAGPQSFRPPLVYEKNQRRPQFRGFNERLQPIPEEAPPRYTTQILTAA